MGWPGRADTIMTSTELQGNEFNIAQLFSSHRLMTIVFLSCCRMNSSELIRLLVSRCGPEDTMELWSVCFDAFSCALFSVPPA